MKTSDKYAAQTRYQSQHYCTFGLKIPLVKRAALDTIAAERGVSVSYLIKDAILQAYGIDCFTQK